MKTTRTRRLLACMCLLCLAVSLWAQGGKDAAPVQENKVLNIWTKFNDTNPQNTQDQWLAQAMKDFEAETGIKVINTFVPWDQVISKLNLAVQAGGDVPDFAIAENDIQFYADNGVLMDITDYINASAWKNDVSPVALDGVVAADGRMYAVPFLWGGSMMYYWTAAYPDGPPKTTEDLLKAGERLAKEGKFAITFKGAESVGAQLFYFQLAQTFGGEFTDKSGKSVFANDGTKKAVEFLRTLFAKKYAPEVCLSAGFDFETPFKDGNAGAFVAGAWSYVYLNPLKSPDGKVFDAGALSVEEALRAGAMGIADPISAPGGRPYTNLSGFGGFGIPTGSKNVEGAKKFLDWLMQPQHAADYAFAYGGLPTNQKSMSDPRFVDSTYWTEVNAATVRNGKVAPVNRNPKFGQKLDETFITLIQKPALDIMAELSKVQKELNAEL